MKMIFKTTLLTTLFFLATLTTKAQDKYDFALVYLDLTKQNVTIHIVQNDVAEKVIETGKKFYDNSGHMERQLHAISQMTTEGWELTDITNFNGIPFYYLRRKKNG